MRILRSMTVKQMCGRPQVQCVEAEHKQCKKYRILTSLAAVIHENKRNASGSSNKLVNSWQRISFQPHKIRKGIVSFFRNIGYSMGLKSVDSLGYSLCNYKYPQLKWRYIVYQHTVWRVECMTTKTCSHITHLNSRVWYYLALENINLSVTTTQENDTEELVQSGRMMR